MGYNEDNLPYYFRPLVDEYDDIEFDSCGYRKGSWVEFYVNGNHVKLRREITDDITVKQSWRGTIKTRIGNGYSNVVERDKLIGERVREVLGGYSSAEEAFNEKF
jgi:hypothetical protein